MWLINENGESVDLGDVPEYLSQASDEDWKETTR